MSLVVQGLSLQPLVRRAGLQTDDERRQREEVAARHQLARRARAHLDGLALGEAAPDHLLDRLRAAVDQRVDRTGREGHEPEAEAAYRGLRRQLIAVESDELDRLHRRGDVDDATRQRLQRALDLEGAGLDDRDRA